MEEKLNQIITNITCNEVPDTKGNRIGYDTEQKMLFYISPEGQLSSVGTIIYESSEVTLLINEVEKNLHHRTKSWGIYLQAFRNVERIKICTELATYVIRKAKAIQGALLFDYSKNDLSVKTYIPKYLWDQEYIVAHGPTIEQFGIEWFTLLKGELVKEYIADLSAFVKRDRAKRAVYPLADDVFKAYRLTPPSETKVVIIGDEPYKGDHSDGLAFSSHDDDVVPEALEKIFREIERDVYEGFLLQFTPDLTRWAVQGVFLLNSTLTTNPYGFGAHVGKGWELFTTETISQLNKTRTGIVYILLGESAQLYKEILDPVANCIIEADSPSSTKSNNKFIGSNIFTQTNAYLENNYGSNYKILW